MFTFPRSLTAFCKRENFRPVYSDKGKTPDAWYGVYRRLNVTARAGADGPYLVCHGHFTRVEVLGRALTEHGFIGEISLGENGNLIIRASDRERLPEEEDYGWILDKVLDFAKECKTRVGGCESCGKSGAEFFSDKKTGEYHCLCERCRKDKHSEFNRVSGGPARLFAGIKRFFAGTKAERRLRRP